MFLSLGVIFVLGIIGGMIFEKIHLPKIVFYTIMGILLGPSVLGFLNEDLLNISSYLRQIALIIILTRSGLSLNIKKLKEIGRPAILMCFLPATFEIIGVVIFGPLLLGISYFEALLLGSVLGAVSPAIVVPRMIKLQSEGYGDKKHLPELIMAGASCDDIYVITLFYAFKGLVATNTFDYWILLEIPTSIIFGIILGIIFGVILIFSFKKVKLPLIIKVILVFGTGLVMLGIENLFTIYNISTNYHIGISSLLGIIVLGIILLKYMPSEANLIKKSYDSMWNGFEILLFTLVGAIVDVKYAFSSTGGIFVGLILLALIFRSLGVIVSISFTKYSFKEKVFIIMSYLPKATVQASIGGIALSEGLACGTMILTGAVISILITAPIGAILMDSTYKSLLDKSINLNSRE